MQMHPIGMTLHVPVEHFEKGAGRLRLVIGVEPDVHVPRDLRYSAGHDPQLEAALDEAARKLVDHSLRFGWDDEHGGFFDEGEPLSIGCDYCGASYSVEIAQLQGLLSAS